MICVYKIQSNIKPERIYIGSAASGFRHRKALHLYNLRHNNHHSKKLQNHFNKYGESDLVFSILICCEKENILDREQFFLDSIKPWFNNSKKAGNCLGVKHSLESRHNMSKSHIGLIRTESHRRNNSIARMGIRLSDEHKQKLRLSTLGKKQSPETIARRIASNTGKKRSEEVKQKMRGRTISEESRKKLSESRKGIVFSKEHKERMSIARKGKSPWNKGLAKLSNEAIGEIRDLLMTMSQKSIAGIYKVNQSHISRIKSNLSCNGTDNP